MCDPSFINTGRWKENEFPIRKRIYYELVTLTY